MKAADMDADGLVDLVVAIDRGVVVLKNLGKGMFSTAKTTYTGPEPRSVQIGDLDGDGRPDIVVAGSASFVVSLLFNAGASTFRRVDYPAGNHPTVLIQTCKSLEPVTIGVFRRADHLLLRGSPIPCPISAFFSMGELRNMLFEDCQIELDRTDLQENLPALGDLTIAELTASTAQAISAANPRVRISNRTATFLAGARTM
jgi:hypothetical protein